MIILNLKRQPTVPLEAEVISPDTVRGLKHAEICELPVYHGKRRLRLDEFFDVHGDGADEVRIRGDLNKVRWIGRGMSSGSIQIDGNVGMHLGSGMTGGAIEVHGDAGDWVGAEMKNGLIRISGNVGGQIGGGYRGSLSGMRNGTILIGGTAGLEVGLRMRRGTIVVGGRVRDFAGLQMKGGTIVLLSGAEIRTGAWMNRGTILSLQPLALMPTFAPSGRCDPAFLRVFASYLNRLGIQIPTDGGFYERFVGDRSLPGMGEICVWQSAQ